MAPNVVEKSAAEQAIQIVQIIGEVVLLLLRLVYYNIEAIYRIFVPVPEASVKGEIVLVTGAGHGLGHQLALQYASHGATVIAWDINEANNKKTVDEIAKKNYPKAYSYVCDVSKREDVFRTIQQVQKEVGDINIVINNAGIMPTHSILDHTQEEIERIFGINVLAHFWIIQAVLPTMIKNKNGHIVALSSMAGLLGLENLVPYCASKFAVVGLMEALHHDLKAYPGCNINLTTICPHMVDTGLCKRPKIRFEKSMPMLKQEEAAAVIISAQRRNATIVTIPDHLLYVNRVARCAPIKWADSLKSFFDVKLESDL